MAKEKIDVHTIPQGVDAVLESIKPLLSRILKNSEPDDWNDLVLVLRARLRNALDVPMGEGSYVGKTPVCENLLRIFSDAEKRQFLHELPNNQLQILNLIAAYPDGIKGDFLLEGFRQRSPARIPDSTKDSDINRLHVNLARLRPKLERVGIKIVRVGAHPAVYRIEEMK